MTAENRLAEEYQKHANRHYDLADTFEGVSTEARLGEPPAWSDNNMRE